MGITLLTMEIKPKNTMEVQYRDDVPTKRGSTEVDGPIAKKIRRAKLKHSFQLARVKGRHR